MTRQRPDKGTVSAPNRSLDPDDRLLWERVARSAKPLRRRPPAPAATDTEAAEQSEPATPKAAKKSASGTARKIPPKQQPAPPPLGRIDWRLTQRLGRGLREVDARIDLHGMRQAEAQEALHGFLARAQASGLGMVLVITGKGRTAPREEAGFMADGDFGVLRRALPHWLALPRFRALAVGFARAHRRHGGEGAFYVQIRRAGRRAAKE